MHLTARAHPTNNSEGSIMKGVRASESFDEGETAIADHVGEFDETALFVLPGTQDNEPMVQENADEFGIEFAHDPPAVRHAPFINVFILLPTLGEQFNLPTFASSNDGIFQAQKFGKCIGEQEKPMREFECLG